MEYSEYSMEYNSEYECEYDSEYDSGTDSGYDIFFLKHVLSCLLQQCSMEIY